VTIDMTLDATSVGTAIRQLERMKENLKHGMCEFVDVMCIDGANIANAAYSTGEEFRGVIANASRDSETDNVVTGHIGVSAEDEDDVIIAEFGAGKTTMTEYDFENPPPVPIAEKSFSESEKGTGEFAKYGSWHHNKQKYYFVEPLHGLLDARNYIRQSATDTAKEVIRLD